MLTQLLKTFFHPKKKKKKKKSDMCCKTIQFHTSCQKRTINPTKSSDKRLRVYRAEHVFTKPKSHKSGRENTTEIVQQFCAQPYLRSFHTFFPSNSAPLQQFFSLSIPQDKEKKKGSLFCVFRVLLSQHSTTDEIVFWGDQISHHRA